jgi:hypothetical protein
MPDAHTGFLKPIHLPNLPLHLIGNLVKHRGGPAIGGLISQFATSFDFTLNPDQKIE